MFEFETDLMLTLRLLILRFLLLLAGLHGYISIYINVVGALLWGMRVCLPPTCTVHMSAKPCDAARIQAV